MKKFDIHSMTGRTVEDIAAINEALDNEIDMTVDEYDRVWTEGGIYIADAIYTELGDGIGC